MTTQITSSKEHWDIGTSNVNCNISIGKQIIMPIVKQIYRMGKMTDEHYKWFDDHNNSALALSVLDSYIMQSEIKHTITDGRTKTNQGILTKIASGVSKTALIFEITKKNRNTAHIVIKYSKRPIDLDDIATFRFKASKEAEERARWTNDQLICQYNRYIDAVKTNNQALLDVILPCFKVYERYNAIIEPYAANIDSLENVCQKTYDNIEKIYRILDENDIYDIRHHSGNSGIYKGRAVVIDYGL